MPELSECDFLLVRYVPDSVRDEFVNIAVVLFGRNRDYAGVRFTSDWAKVRCLDPSADLDLLQALEDDLRQQFTSDQRTRVLERLQDSLSHGLQVTQPKVLLANAPEEELERLAKTYLERPKLPRDAREGARRRIVREMQNAFETAGVWKSINKKIRAADFTRAGDPLQIDCGYQPNGVVRLFHGVAVSSDPESAKALSFSYPALAEGIQREKHATAELTAVIDSGTADLDEREAFAIDTLKESGIKIARIPDLAAIAERARVELRL